MVFNGELPKSEGYNAILVMTTVHLMQHYIPACHIWRLYGLPKQIAAAVYISLLPQNLQENYTCGYVFRLQVRLQLDSSSTHGYLPSCTIYGWQPHILNIVIEPDFASPAAEEWLDRTTAVYSHMANTLKKIKDKRSELSLDKARKFKVRECW